MKILHTKIGDHFIQFENAPLYLFKMFRELGEANHQPDLTVTIQLDFGVPFLNDDVREDRQADRIYFRRSDYLVEVDAAFQYAEISAYDELALKHALINLYSSFIVHHGWGLLLHSSCVIENGKAHIFTGHSGAGKSTAAALSFPRNLLSDEATILKISAGKMEVFNSPFRSEIPSGGEETVFPLGSIQVLHQSLQNQRIILPKSDSLITMIDKVFYWSNNPAHKKVILDMLVEMAKKVPIYNLFFQKDNTFWELIS
ncbi:hypothetical protein GW626_10935 [Peribacillus muralis]|uniref:hypothetical protein n=1 Tax=Peribacillus muralis TaxID=264697 RepID=UPI001F4EE432|nr:hypothetical protein [Peribacillus muralis]MCK1993423.1 hypothetical protein [Peribacillus muralis]MCK2014289.1 hypothetical protein [Peribacillus muralis]